MLNHISNGFRGILAALTAGITMLMGQAFIIGTFYLVAGRALNAAGNFLTATTAILTILSFPLGIYYGTFRASNIKSKRPYIRFIINTWAASSIAGLLALMQYTGSITLGSALHIILSLLVFLVSWIGIMEVIIENPLSFEHLNPGEYKPKERPDQQQSYLIKKRNG